jgi:sugar lactone lactonase YvrE
LFVADRAAIRKIVITTGVVTTLAGSKLGTPGSADGAGPAARFNNPVGLAADAAGNLFVADMGNLTIRRIVLASGMVSTLAGTASAIGTTDGTGPDARFYSPFGLAADAVGNLFVADAHNHTIRKIVISTGAVTTLAGAARQPGSTDATGDAARFSFPLGLAADAGGNLLVSDHNNHTIRKIVVATGAVTTLAGTASQSGSTDAAGAAARFAGPAGLAADGSGNLFVADYNNHIIRKIVIATGEVSTLSGTVGLPGSTDGTGSNARFTFPNWLAADNAGNLFVTGYDHTIRKIIVATGAVSTLAGTIDTPGSTDATGTSARFNHPAGLVADGHGNLFVADMGNHTIRQIVIATSAVTTVAGSAGMLGRTDAGGVAARFYYPQGLAADPAGDLFVSDYSNHTVRKIVIATGKVTTLAGAAGMFGSTDATGVAARFYHPLGLAADASGNLFVSGYRTIRKIVVSTGAVSTVVGGADRGAVQPGPLPAALNIPRGVVTRSSGDLAITDMAENAVLIARGL